MIKEHAMIEQIAQLAMDDLESIGKRFRPGAREEAAKAGILAFGKGWQEVKTAMKGAFDRHRIVSGWDGSIA